MIKEIEKHQKKYNKIIAILMKLNGINNKKYRIIEKELDREGIQLRKKHGVFAEDPCPLTGGKTTICDDCSGLYKYKITGKTESGKDIHKGRQVKKLKEDVFVCEIKKIMSNA